MLRARLFWRWCRVHPKTSGIGAAVVALIVLVGALGDSDKKATPTAGGVTTTSASSPASSSAPAPAESLAPVDIAQRGRTTALALLATVPVKGRAARTGYSRTQFGQAWTDDTTDPLGHNGCDTRNDILRRDLTAVVLKPGSNRCAVLSGALHDPYTATSIGFTRSASTSGAVQIDHVVALSDAWQTGAARWTVQTRTDLANDPLNLLAVDGPTNEAKGDGDAATWLPPNKAYRCAYVARQVAVKSRYRLWTTQAEHDAVARVLATCPAQPAPTEPGVADVRLTPRRSASNTPSTTAPAPTTALATTPAPSTSTSTSTGDVYYPNCAAVRAAGAAPLHRGDPGYSAHLDRDGDGVACE